MHRKGAEAQRENEITNRVIGFAIEVHRSLGPGLLESTYEECLCYELAQHQMPFRRQLPLPVLYKGIQLECGYRMDLVLDDLVIIEVKAIERLLPIHEAQLLTYLKLAGKSVGLLINFNVPVLRTGLKRIVNHFPDSSAPLRLGGENSNAPALS
jgi:GxxExxY protein